MSTANTTRIFGVRLGVDPKILIGVLVALAGLLFWYNSRSDDETSSSAAPRTAAGGNSGGTMASGEHKPAPRRTSGQGINDRGILRMRAIDPTKGDVDPTLHLDLLSRLHAVGEGKIGRSVFEIGPSPESVAAAAAIKGPKIPVSPILQAPLTPVNVTPEINIPFKYYGYAKPEEKTEANRGLFLDDSENVVVASEGQTVKGHYLIVELTPKNARIEDTNVRQGKTLPVMPMAQQP